MTLTRKIALRSAGTGFIGCCPERLQGAGSPHHQTGRSLS